jgi:hypothetical protein
MCVPDLDGRKVPAEIKGDHARAVSSSSPAAKTLAGIARASETVDNRGRQPNQPLALGVRYRLAAHRPKRHGRRDRVKRGLTCSGADHGRLRQEKQRRSRPDPEARPRQYEAQEAAPASTRGCLYRGGQRFESPPLHQEVGANRRDFLRLRIARHCTRRSNRRSRPCRLRELLLRS